MRWQNQKVAKAASHNIRRINLLKQEISPAGVAVITQLRAVVSRRVAKVRNKPSNPYNRGRYHLYLPLTFSSNELCTAIGNLDHSLKQDFGIISTYLKGVSETPSLGVRVFDTYGIPKTKLVLTLRNCGLNKRMHFIFLVLFHTYDKENLVGNDTAPAIRFSIFGKKYQSSRTTPVALNTKGE